MNSVEERTGNSKSDAKKRGRSDEEEMLAPFDDFYEYVKQYARERPDVTIFTCLGIGFILGWKLKPW